MKKICNAFKTIENARKTFAEIAVLQQLQHSNIVEFKGLLSTDTSCLDCYYTMELIGKNFVVTMVDPTKKKWIYATH